MKRLSGLILFALLGGMTGCFLAHKHPPYILPPVIDDRIPIPKPLACLDDEELRYRVIKNPPEGRIRCV